MLRLTDAGRAALMDGANRQTNAVQLRSMRIGDGLGPGGAADDSRTTLRSQRDSEDVVGTTMVSGRLAVRATFEPASAYRVTEVGLVARIGDAGAEFLFAYFAVPSAVDAIATTVPNGTLVIAGVIDATNSSAEIKVTIDPSITFGGPGTLVALSDVPDQFDANLFLRANNTATAGLWSEAPPCVATEGDLPAAAQAVNSTYKVTTYGNTGRPALALKRNNAWRYLQPPENLIPRRTRMVFYQAAAPVGWTKVANVNDRLLRVVSGDGGGTGGNWRISGLSVGGTALTVDQLPGHSHGSGSLAADDSGSDHTHSFSGFSNGGGGAGNITGLYLNGSLTQAGRTSSSGAHDHDITGSTAETGGGEEHGHSLAADGNWRPAYADVIICSKD